MLKTINETMKPSRENFPLKKAPAEQWALSDYGISLWVNALAHDAAPFSLW